MEKLSLEEIRKIEFELLKKFDCFCKDNGIKYFLSNGTLLGAVKYKGFIPWDDDIDVLVPRDHYNRVLELFNSDERYQLFAFEKNKNYGFPFAKLCDMTTRKEESNIDNCANLGVDIDIFPLDSWYSDRNTAEREACRICRNIFFLTLTKRNKPDSHHPVKWMIKAILIFFCKMLGSRFFIRSIIRKSINAHKENTYLGCKSWPIYGSREIIPQEVFADTVEVEFEGDMFPAPVGYDMYLRSLYGNYEKDPPLDKQKTHHRFVAYRI